MGQNFISLGLPWEATFEDHDHVLFEQRIWKRQNMEEYNTLGGDAIQINQN